MTQAKLRLAVIQVIACALLGVAWLQGLVTEAIESDSTHIIVWTIATVVLATSLATWWQRGRAWTAWTCEWAIPAMLGFLGTALGLMQALAGLTGDVDAQKLAGVETALVTTIVGIIATLYLLLIERVSR